MLYAEIGHYLQCGRASASQDRASPSAPQGMSDVIRESDLIIFTVALGLWLAMCYGMGYIAMHFILKYW